MEELVPLYTADGHVRWCSHYGRQSLSSSKHLNMLTLWPSDSISTRETWKHMSTQKPAHECHCVMHNSQSGDNSADGWRNPVWYVHTRRHCSAQKGIKYGYMLQPGHAKRKKPNIKGCVLYHSLLRNGRTEQSQRDRKETNGCRELGGRVGRQWRLMDVGYLGGNEMFWNQW